MSPTRPTSAGTDTNDAIPHMSDEQTSDADDHDEEATSAADAHWLAELRATARQRETSLADVVGDQTLGDQTLGDGDGDGDGDDEATVGSPTALDDIRRFAREEREGAANSATPTDAPTTLVDAIDASDHDGGLPVPTAPQTLRAVEPSPVPRERSSMPEPQAPPVIRRNEPILGAANVDTETPRWEAPPRLEAAVDPGGPAVLDRSGPRSGTDWRITALAIAVALLLGVVVTLLFLRDDPADPVDDDPDTTTLVDGSAVSEAPADPPTERQEEGS